MNYTQARNGVRRENGACKDKLRKPGHRIQESLGEVGRIEKRISKVSNINGQLCNGAWGLLGAKGVPEKSLFFLSLLNKLHVSESRVWKPAHVGFSLFSLTWYLLRKCSSLAFPYVLTGKREN